MDESLLMPLEKATTESKIIPSNFELYCNKRNTYHLKHENHIYVYNYKRRNTVYWRCIFHRKYSCRITLATFGNEITKLGGTHIHLTPDFNDYQRKLIRIHGTPDLLLNKV